MEESNVAVLVDAKAEYTKQLVNIIRPYIYDGVKSIYDDAKEICDRNNTPNSTLMTFQKLLSNIPKWSQEIIDQEYDRIISESQCDWLEDLITAVFVSHTKILSVVHTSNKSKKINLKIPKADHFIHKCYIECAREFWKNPYLFSDKLGQYEYQRNIRDAEHIIGESICETIRKQLPVKHILREYLGNDFNDDEEEENVEGSITDSYRNNLKKIVQKEIEKCTKIRKTDEKDIRKLIRTALNITDEEEPEDNKKVEDNKETDGVEEAKKVDNTKTVEDNKEVENTLDTEINLQKLDSSDNKTLPNTNTGTTDSKLTVISTDSTAAVTATDSTASTPIVIATESIPIDSTVIVDASDAVVNSTPTPIVTAVNPTDSLVNTNSSNVNTSWLTDDIDLEEVNIIQSSTTTPTPIPTPTPTPIPTPIPTPTPTPNLTTVTNLTATTNLATTPNLTTTPNLKPNPTQVLVNNIVPTPTQNPSNINQFPTKLNEQINQSSLIQPSNDNFQISELDDFELDLDNIPQHKPNISLKPKSDFSFFNDASL